MMSFRSRIFILLTSIFISFLVLPFSSHSERGISIRPISPTGEKVIGNQWLFVIGIDTYIHWPRLSTAVNDAKSVKDVLLSRYHFTKDHLIELYDETATRKNIIRKLRILATKLEEDDSLIIFYAGHGHLDSITKSGSWIPVESGIDDASAWISNHDIKNYLKVDAIKAKHVLLISDSCFAGDFFRGKRGKLPIVTETVIKKAYELTSRQAITSGGLEPVSDAGFGNNSVFSHFLIRTLKENKKPFLVPSDFFARIKAGVVENAEQFPRFGTLQGTGGQQGGEIVLFLKQESRLEDLTDGVHEKSAELERLRQMEEEAKRARDKEMAEIAKQERAMAQLDRQIGELRKRLGAPDKSNGDSLDTLVVMVEKKEIQQKRIDELKKQKQDEEAKRQAEIERLKAEKRAIKAKELKEDLKKYEKIVSSKFGKDFEIDAWNRLIAKYPEGKDIEIGNAKELLFIVNDKINAIGMKFVYIKPGMFMMGSPSGESGRDNDEKQHRVTLTQGFYMQTTEVTQGQWKAVMGNKPSHFKKCGNDCPVEKVSWNDVQEFIRKLNQKEGGNKYRLPTEAQWEYACRAGRTTRYNWGDNDNCSKANYGNSIWTSECKGTNPGKTMKVASFSPNAWGLYDMHGNVWEWCQDWYDDYPSGSVTDPTGSSSGSSRVFRGGGLGQLRQALSFGQSRRLYPGLQEQLPKLSPHHDPVK